MMGMICSIFKFSQKFFSLEKNAGFYCSPVKRQVFAGRGREFRQQGAARLAGPQGPESWRRNLLEMQPFVVTGLDFLPLWGAPSQAPAQVAVPVRSLSTSFLLRMSSWVLGFRPSSSRLWSSRGSPLPRLFRRLMMGSTVGGWALGMSLSPSCICLWRDSQNIF